MRAESAGGGGTAGAALAVLLELMASSDNDHVRVAAAKIVLARAIETEEQAMRKPNHDQERQEAIDAIARLLDELAAAKSQGDAGAAELDQGGAPAADHAKG